MKTIWLTYSWLDNENKDVDFIAQELLNFGIGVKLDRWNIQAGRRLWDQIANFIENPTECDGWILYATQNSLGSEACREEFSIALDRALHARSEVFPIFGLFPNSIERDLIPASIRNRLYISLTDPNWKERIKASLEGRPILTTKESVEPYSFTIHQQEVSGKSLFCLEIRPRAGSWSPFFMAIPMDETAKVQPQIRHGPKNKPFPMIRSVVLTGVMEGEIMQRGIKWWWMSASDEATPTTSYYLECQTLPSSIIFGVLDEEPKYVVTIPQ